MKNMMLAHRYAKALYSLASDQNEQDLVFNQLTLLCTTFQNDKEIDSFLQSPTIRPVEKVKAMEKLIQAIGLAKSLENFLLVLAKKGRLGALEGIQRAYQEIADEAHGVTRGVVRSATVLPPEERKRIETLVGRATGKQVILSYKEDPELLGGLVAHVGSFTFDDSLTSHLKRINEQITRSTH